jgi:hypothetical protein
VKRKYILISLAAVLAVAIFLTLVVTKRQALEQTAVEETPEERRIEISMVEPEEIREIELMSPERRLRLYIKEGRWQVEHPYPIDLDQRAAVEDLAYTFARLVAEKVIDANPEDLAQFGLDPPRVTGTATLADGGIIELRLGNLTPVRNTYYLMRAGDPAVYAVWANHGLHLSYSLDDLRNKELPRIAKQNIQYLKISRLGDRTIEMQRVDEAMLTRYPFFQSRYVLFRPYRALQPVSMEELPRFLNQVPPQLKIFRFVDDRPDSLAAYGLDPPQTEVVIKDADTELHLLVGSQIDESLVYARRGEGGSVFALEKSELKFIEAIPFELIEKFAFIVFIGYVDRIEIRHNGQLHRIDIIRPGEGSNTATSYRVDGSALEEQTVKQLYQSLISLMVEAELPSVPSTEASAELELLYTLNRGQPRAYRLEFVPYDQDFYALFKNGTAEFLISRQQVKTVLRDVETFLQAEVTSQ